MRPQTPVRSTRVAKRDTSILEFKDHDPAPTEFQMIGGICWPKPDPRKNNEVYGFAVVLGIDLEANEIVVFEEEKFYTVDHMLDKETGFIEREGACSFFTKAWHKYYCSRFYCNQPQDMRRKYLMQCLRSEMVRPNPVFIPVHWDALSEPEQCMYEHLELGRLHRRDAQLHDEMETHMSQAGAPTHASAPVHALFCALIGQQKFPWLEPRKPDDDTPIIHVMATGPIIR